MTILLVLRQLLWLMERTCSTVCNGLASHMQAMAILHKAESCRSDAGLVGLTHLCWDSSSSALSNAEKNFVYAAS